MWEIMAPKESKKGWEKERRDRLNTAFDNLGKLLPCFDPSIKFSKIEILDKATTYIEDLNRKVNKPLTEVNEESDKQDAVTEVTKLNERIHKLQSRNELLNNLLKNAGIKTPKEYGFKNISPTKKWSQKINPNLAKILAQKEAQKENKPIKRKKPTKICRTNQKVPVIKKRLNVKARRRRKSATRKTTIRLQNLVPIANVQPCYFISNSNNNSNKNLKQTSNVVNPSPVLSSNLKPISQIINSNIPTFNTLPSTTLLLTNNNIPTVYQNAPFIVKPTYILVSNQQSSTKSVSFSSAVSDSSTVDTITKSLAPLRPKKRTVTTTTQINKLPIPALTSSYGNNYLVLSNNKHSDKKSAKKVKRPVKDSDSKHNRDELPSKQAKCCSEVVSKDSISGNVTNSTRDEEEEMVNNTNTTSEEVNKISLNQSVSVNSTNVDQPKLSLPENSSSKIVNINPTSEVSPPKTSLTKHVHTTTTPKPVLLPLKHPPNIITDKELLNSINNTTDKDIETIVNQTELPHDLFATLQVPSGSQNPDSTSPTAAFLNAFPLVSSKIQEVLEDETSDSRRDTPTLLQIGTIDVTKTTQTVSDHLTPSLMNLDNFSFFNSKDIYQPFDNIVAATTSSATDAVFIPTCVSLTRSTEKISSKAKIVFENEIAFLAKPASVCSHIPQHNINGNVKQNLPANNQKLTESKLQINAKSPMNVAKKNLFPVNSTTANSITNSSYINQMCYTSVTSSISSVTYQSNKSKISSDKYPKCNPNPLHQTASVKINQIPECNTLNPFNDIPKSNSNCSYNIPAGNIYGANGNYHYNYQTDLSANCNSSNKQYCNKETTSVSTNQSRYYGYDNYDNFDGNICAPGNYYPDKSKFADQQKSVINKSTDLAPKPPVNWMTTPDLKQTQLNSDFLLFPTNKEPDQVPSYSQNNFNNNYFNASAPIYQPLSGDYNMLPDPKKHFDLPFQRNDHDDHQINWSPIKHVGLDSGHNFGALPTLEGDLALGTQSTCLESKLATPKKDLNCKPKEARRNIVPNFETPKKILSVSQFVEPFCKPSETPAKVSNRRNSGGRVKGTMNPSSKSKRSNKPVINEVVKDAPTYGTKTIGKNQYKSTHNHNHNQNQNSFIPDHAMWLSSTNTKPIGNSVSKNISSGTYTAESLISHQSQSEVLQSAHSKSARTNQQFNYPKSLPTPSFLPDNIMPYFPTMDMPSQDNNNQAYGTNSFPAASFPVSIQNTYNNNYNLPTPSISTNYLQPPNYLPDLGNHDYGLLSDNIFSHTPNVKLNENLSSKSCNNKSAAKVGNHTKGGQDNPARKGQFNYPINANYLPSGNQKKSKKKQGTSMDGAPNVANIDFGFPLMPGSINSPILPDEFHTNFLPPPPNPHQLYSCKTPLYGTKQSSDLLPLPPVTRSNIQHPEISPSNNIGSTLTNFNLSAIFPEINKISIPSENYVDYRSKNLPIPFSNKTNYGNNSLITASSNFTNP